MFFFQAAWYAMSTIGAASIVLFVVMMLSIFNNEHIERNIGYRNYIIMLGVYVLGALPLAATINGGTGGDFLFYLGCLCPGLWQFGNQLEKSFLAQRASVSAALASKAAAAAMPRPDSEPQRLATPPSAAPRPAYQPAAASLSGDFDIPPQE